MAQLTPENSVLLVVDYQQRIMPAIRNHQEVLDKAAALIEGARQLSVPIVVTEQYPKGLGHTVDSIKAVAGDNATTFEKTAFGALNDRDTANHLRFLNKPHVVVCGVETHVCVSQTVLKALEDDYTVHLVVDATSSRHKIDHKTALTRLSQAGVILHTVESLLFTWLNDSAHPQFKTLQGLIK